MDETTPSSIKELSVDERNVFSPLTDEEIEIIGRSFGLPSDKARELIVKGVQMIGSSAVTNDSNITFRDENEKSIVEDRKIVSPHDSPVAFNLDNSSNNRFAIFLQNSALLELMGVTQHTAEGFYKLKGKYNGIDQREFSWFYDLFRESEVAKILLTIRNTPHKDDLFTFSFESTDGQTAAIIPFRLEQPDVTADVGVQSIGEVFIRGTSTLENSANIMKYASELDREVANIKTQLNLPSHISRVEVIFDTQEKYGSPLASSYFKAADEEQQVIYTPVECLNSLKDQKHRARLLRHEYLHTLFNSIGNGGRSFTEINERQIFNIVNKHLFNGECLFEEVVSDGETHWPDSRKIYEVFTEHNVFPDSPHLGHSESSISELFTSCINSYYDPEFDRIRGSAINNDIRDKVFAELNEFLVNKIDKAK